MKALIKPHLKYEYCILRNLKIRIERALTIDNSYYHYERNKSKLIGYKIKNNISPTKNEFKIRTYGRKVSQLAKMQKAVGIKEKIRLSQKCKG